MGVTRFVASVRIGREELTSTVGGHPSGGLLSLDLFALIFSHRP